jgi:hypothetical protein
MSNTQQLLDNREGIDPNENAALHDVRTLKHCGNSRSDGAVYEQLTRAIDFF